MCRQLDLREVDDPNSGFTLRRLWLFYDHLPSRNEINRSILKMTPLEYDEMWHTSNAQLADLIDAVQYNTFALMKVNADKRTSGSIKQPKPYPRPSYGPSGKQEPVKPKKNPLEGLPTIRV